MDINTYLLDVRPTSYQAILVRGKYK